MRTPLASYAFSFLRGCSSSNRWVVRVLPITVILASLVTASLQAEAAKPMFELLIQPPPEPSARAGFLYMDPRKRTVLEYDLGPTGDFRVYFTDGSPLFGINDKLAYALGNTPYRLGKFTEEHGLTPLKTIDLGGQIEGLVTIRSYSFDGSKCQWPYATAYEIQAVRHPPQQMIFLRRREKPRVATYQFWCERGPGVLKLTTMFDVLAPSIFLDDNGIPLLEFHSPPTVFQFNPDGMEIGPRLGSDILVVPAGLSKSLLTMAAEAEVSPELAVELFEADVNLIDPLSTDRK